MKSESAHASQGKNLPGGAAVQTGQCAMNTFQEKAWLLVDDNEEILTTISALLETLTGATVECHSSAGSALAAFTAAPGRYELIVTDYEMPGMNGVELCRRLKAVAPDQKIIL